MKIHDWERAYWINSSGEREYDPSGIEPEENVLCIYENDHGDRVAYALTDRSEQVEVTLDMSDFDADEAEGDRSEAVQERLNETLREIEDEAEERFRSTSVVDREEDGDEVAVTVEITWDVGKYEVRFNGELLTDVEFEEGSRWFKEGDGGRQEQFQEARLRTRADAREFAAAWRDDFGAPEQLGYVEVGFEEVMEMEYEAVQELAKQAGVSANQSHEDLARELSGEEAPEEVEA